MSIERISLGIVNCYLILGPKQAVLVDTGGSGSCDRILQAVGSRKISLIALTHGHSDHAANARLLADRLDVKIAIHREDEKIAGVEEVRPLKSEGFLGKIIQTVSASMMKNVPVQPLHADFYLEDGMDLAEYGVDARIVGLDGHTKGSVGFLSDKEMIVGDAMFNMANLPARSRIFENKERMIRSVETIRRCGCTLLYPGHGGSICAEKFFAKYQP